jgi:hypothetical protein
MLSAVLRIRTPTLSALALLTLLVAPAALAKPPSWDKRIDGKGRFKVLKAFDGEAVLDKETGLVWQQDPAATAEDFDTANVICLFTAIGGRGGWRLPRFEELASVINPENGAVPEGHPFELPPSTFWTATTLIQNDGPLSTAVFLLDNVNGATVFTAKDSTVQNRVWCVRGGAGIDDQ